MINYLFKILISISLDIYPAVDLLDHIECNFYFKRKFHIILSQYLYSFSCLLTVFKSSYALHRHQHIYLFFVIAILTNINWKLILLDAHFSDVWWYSTLLFLFYVYGHFPANMSVYGVCIACGDQRRKLDAQKLELSIDVRCHVGAEQNLSSLGKQTVLLTSNPSL